MNIVFFQIDQSTDEQKLLVKKIFSLFDCCDRYTNSNVETKIPLLLWNRNKMEFQWIEWQESCSVWNETQQLRTKNGRKRVSSEQEIRFKAYIW